MKNRFIKKIIGITLGCLMLCSGVVVSAKDGGTSSNPGYIYYRSNGNLFKAAADGSGSIEIVPNYDSKRIIPAKKYVYYYAGQNSTTLLRVANDGSEKQGKRFAEDVVNVYADDNNIYYMTDEGKIYAAASDCASASDAKEIADMADVKNGNTWLAAMNGRVYYNSLKSGRIDYVTSVSADGTGKKYLAKGIVSSNYYLKKDSKSAYLMVNTKPQETRYSTKCMVMYSIKLSTGSAKAINSKKPIDHNAVSSGRWINGYYVYNSGIKNGSSNFNYNSGKAYALSTSGKTIKIYKKSAYEVANLGSNKIVFNDASGNSYAVTVKGNKVSAAKKISVKLTYHVRNLGGQDDKSNATLFSEYGIYSVNSQMKPKKLTGIEWDECWYDWYDDNTAVAGLFYINAGDNNYLYYATADGKTNIRVSTDKVTRTEDIDGVYYISQY
ncbi:hypothetical protein [Clostridium oryzae]|uniref:DUF5050 domain-containing protein n=1 Tax=Clostridium oryzae TaxID=1450648 RepID=A0A1V4IR04_9CLOT|nr:hypothetical protein [Clostridium oryzae]OPJ62234.1 hypothetical protein CLORY_18420 [Clostridium oryzae]